MLQQTTEQTKSNDLMIYLTFICSLRIEESFAMIYLHSVSANKTKLINVTAIFPTIQQVQTYSCPPKD